jgi:ribosomal protein S18 acetylase RimI-like enzyme
MPLEIRPANTDDYNALVGLYRDADRMAHEWLPHFFRPIDEFERSREEIGAQIVDDDTALFVVEEDGVVLGLVMAVMQSSPPWSGFVKRRFVEVVDLAVAPGARRRGIARRLMHAAEEWALSRSADSVDLTVVEGNEAALALYQGTGYDLRSYRMWKRLG